MSIITTRLFLSRMSTCTSSSIIVRCLCNQGSSSKTAEGTHDRQKFKTLSDILEDRRKVDLERDNQDKPSEPHFTEEQIVAQKIKKLIVDDEFANARIMEVKSPWIKEDKEGLTTTSEEQEEWTTIYSLGRSIFVFKLVCRLKIYQTIFTVLVTSASMLMYVIGRETFEQTLFNTLASCFALSVLVAIGQFFRRQVGFVYVSKNKQLVKLAHLTFWGRRRDVIIPVSSIVPLHQFQNSGFRGIYLPLFVKRDQLSEEVSKNVEYSSFYLSPFLGTIRDRSLFEDVMGELPNFRWNFQEPATNNIKNSPVSSTEEKSN